MDQEGHILDIRESMVAGEEIIDNKVPQYKKNNLLACLNIPKRKRGKGYEELVNFIQGHPLSTAFTKGIYLIPQVLLEFWYTCRVEGNAGDIIVGTVNDGENIVTISPDYLRKILRLPILPKYDPVVSKSQARSVLLEIGNPTATGVIKKSQFTTKWGFIVSTIVRSLGTKIGSLDSVNDVEMQLLYAIVKGREVDYAQLFFNELKTHVCKKPRDAAAPYSRFVSLCIQDSIGIDLYDSLGEVFETVDRPKLTFKMFNGIIQDDEVELPSAMRFWIDNPFQPASSSSEATDYCTSLQSLDILAQAVNVTSRNQGVIISSSQQSPIDISELTKKVRDLASAFQNEMSSYC